MVHAWYREKKYLCSVHFKRVERAKISISHMPDRKQMRRNSNHVLPSYRTYEPHMCVAGAFSEGQQTLHQQYHGSNHSNHGTDK
jgi:hypothetical protein